MHCNSITGMGLRIVPDTTAEMETFGRESKRHSHL